MTTSFVGVDVQVTRGCPYAVIDAAAVVVERGWVGDAGGLRAVVERLACAGPVVVGIDAPRMPLPLPRSHGLAGGRWVCVQRENGRHAELAVKALGLANPQWTPLADRAPPWMALGFSLFRALDFVIGDRLAWEDQHIIETHDPPEIPRAGSEVSVRSDRATLAFRRYYDGELRDSYAALATSVDAETPAA